MLSSSNLTKSLVTQCYTPLFLVHFLETVQKEKKKDFAVDMGQCLPRTEALIVTGSTTVAKRPLRGAWSDRDTNDIFAHCSLIFYFLDFKFSNFVCPSKLHRLIWFFLKNSFRKKKNIRKTSQNALAPSIFIVWSIVLKLGTPLLHIQAQNTLLQNF